jgi:hypothetical protein
VAVALSARQNQDVSKTPAAGALRVPERPEVATKPSGDEHDNRVVSQDKPDKTTMDATSKHTDSDDKRIGKGASSGPVSDEMAKKQGPSNKDTKHPNVSTSRVEDQPVKREGTLASAKTKGTVRE